MRTEFWWVNVLDSGNLEDREADGKNTKLDLREIGCDEGRRIKLDQDRAQWHRLVLHVLSFGLVYNSPSSESYRNYLQQTWFVTNVIR
jgi:hypothetical protein